MDIKLDNGDISGTLFGDIALTNDEEYDIIQNANHNVLTKAGSIVLHPEHGNTAFTKRVKLSQSHIDTMKVECSNAILQDVRVDSVVDMSITKSVIYGQCDIGFIIVTYNGSILTSGVAVNII